MRSQHCPMKFILALSATVVAFGISALASVQSADAPAHGAPLTGKGTAPVDLTGYWVSVIDTDWRWRMMTPEKGNYNRAAITPAAKAVGDSWDPDKDIAAGEQCRAYGAAGLMRIPGRLHITWQNDNTLKVDTDAGTQTRLLRFGTPQAPSQPAAQTWQGDSTARWDVPPGADPKHPPMFGSLHVVTTDMRMGYLLKNGLPYSSDAVMTEDWAIINQPDGSQWLVITTTVDDPKYLLTPRITAPVFKREPDGSTKWNPTPCLAK
jgi:hypothetical protein